MRKIIVFFFAMLAISGIAKTKKVAPRLTFDASKGEACTITTVHGQEVKYTAYTKLYYVTNIEDSTYQYLNVFVPEGATQKSPIFMRNYVGGYMASAPGFPQASDASGRALAEGMVVVIPGVRGRNATIEVKQKKKTKTVYTGRAPKCILDLKAAVRYLRLFDKEMPGDAEKIITDGTSAGGAMSALQGATANDPIYEPYLKAMGAAETKDNIFAAVCYCPIIDLDHADMTYEWLYGKTNSDSRLSTPDLKRVSNELADQFPEYIKSLGLRLPDGTPLTTDNYLAYIKSLIIESAQEAKDAGAVISDTLGFKFSSEGGWNPPINGKAEKQGMKKMPSMMRRHRQGDCILDLDMAKYLAYVASTVALKPCPSFDNKGVAGNNGTGENDEFGDETGSQVNFTDYALQQATGNNDARIDDGLRQNVKMLNPMEFLREGNDNIAPHWYIRHGARDRDTAFPVPINLALKLQNIGKDVDFKLPWNRPHSGDYALNDLFRWIKEITK